MIKYWFSQTCQDDITSKCSETFCKKKAENYGKHLKIFLAPTGALNLRGSILTPFPNLARQT